MKKKTAYTRAPKDIEEAIKDAVVMEDFLPSPEELIAREQAVKVTLALGKASVDFFKKVARENHVPYQAMIRKVVDLYALRHMRRAGWTE